MEGTTFDAGNHNHLTRLLIEAGELIAADMEHLPCPERISVLRCINEALVQQLRLSDRRSRQPQPGQLEQTLRRHLTRKGLEQKNQFNNLKVAVQ
ncbi:hypothetical protein GCM10023189_43260 [Nibrella saemangeumensis]|uniref:Uncharacterized protein n=1 Tax=Nibrella saemangeumensis TaxID=1084526 RepID=A0ABP8NAT6_9BACT